jgi:chorismate synthase
MRVAAGAIARRYLRERLGIEIHAWLAQLGPIDLAAVDLASVDDNPFFCADPSRVAELEDYMDALRKSGDSMGARINCIATGVPPGLGEPVYGKLDQDLASAMMSINAAKGIEIGAGFESVAQPGSEHRDEIGEQGFLSNHAGGILGGISTGQALRLSVAFKPTSSLRLPGQTIDVHGEPAEVITTGRHDPCVGIRATPIVEAMMALVIMDHVLRHRAQNADVVYPISPVPAND